MTLNADLIADRRRVKRSNMIWRAIAIAAVVISAIVAGLAGVFGEGLGISGSHIARVQIDGLITGPRAQLAMLNKISKSKRVKGVIVHVNSPGGTTAGSEAVYESLRKLAAKKPVVTVMGSQATSGGYITAIAADYIVARGNTLTGSIGVIMQWPNAKEALKKLGIQYEEVKSDPLKAEPNPFSDASPEAIAVVRSVIDDSHKWFVGLVAQRRKMDETEARKLGDGRVYTGRQALEVKLIDAIGGEDVAVKWLRDKKKLSKELKVITWKPKRPDELSFVRMSVNWLGEVFAGGFVNGIWQETEKRLAPEGLRLDGLISVWQPKE
ncbi:MAG: signal peptide peptidase SppA [Hyphomicrobiales bacterium]